MAERTYEEQLAGVPPRLWQRTLERAAVIDLYLKISRPGTAEADAHAEKLGVSRRFFYKLVRIFEERRSAPSRKIKTQYSSGRIEQASEGVIKQVIAEFGVETRLSDLAKEIQRRCEETQIPVPSASAIRMRFNAARLAMPVAQDLPAIVIDHCGLLLPIDRQGMVDRAVITAVIHPGTGLILGHHVGATAPGPDTAASALLDALQPRAQTNRRSKSKLEVAFERNDDPAWDILSGALSSTGIRCDVSNSTPRSPGRTLMRIVGTRLGRIDLAPRSTFTPRSSFPGAGPAVTLNQARATIREIIEQRNTALDSDLVIQELVGARRTTALRVALQAML